VSRQDPHRISAVVRSPGGVAYRGKFGCTDILCTRDLRESERCYGWHCLYCDGRSNCQGDCSNPECLGKEQVGA
jgi:hypothetical protein